MPEIGDEIIQFGNRADVKRQQAIVLSAYGSDAPSMKQYAKVNSYDLTGKEVTVISPAGNRFTGSFIIEDSGKDLVQQLNDVSGNLEAFKVETNAKFEVNDDRIDLSVSESKDYADSLVDGIEVGGVNMLSDTSSDVAYVNRNSDTFDTIRTVNLTSLGLKAGDVVTASIIIDGEGIFPTTDASFNIRYHNGSTGYFKGEDYSNSHEGHCVVASKIRSGSTHLAIIVRAGTGLYKYSYKELQLEKGNKATAWSLSPADAQKEANEYADEKDTELNNSISELRTETNAQFTVQANQIASKVSQTSFDALGNRVSSAESKIVQNASDITLSVSESKDYANNLVDGIEVGGVNLLPVTNQGTTGWSYVVSGGENTYSSVEVLGVQGVKSTCTLVTSSYHVIAHKITRGLIENNKQYTFSMDVYCEFDTEAEIYLRNSNASNILLEFGGVTIKKNEWTHVTLSAETTSDKTTNQLLYMKGFNHLGSVIFANLKLEKGNKATAWSPSESDRLAEANKYADEKDTELASSLTITANKISLASQTIELTGNVLADAIEIGGDLKVGSRDSAAALEVSKSGAFYAKGSDGSNQMIVDSDEQLIELKSDKVADGISGTESGTTVIRMSSGDGSISVRGATSAASNSSTVVGNGGVFANTALQTIYPASTGIQAKASIVGLGQGNVPADVFGAGFVAGVYGRASNKSTAPAYGGYFDILRTNGLVLGMKLFTSSTAATTVIENNVSLVVSTSSKVQTCKLRDDAYAGTVIRFRQAIGRGSIKVILNDSSTTVMYDDDSSNEYFYVECGWSGEAICLGKLNVNGALKTVWLFGRFKF
ncbi:MAG: hypothetical protein ACK5LV_11190 [Lachnospirales bacterium]